MRRITCLLCLGIIILVSGCATFIDRLPPGTPKGYVKFQKICDRTGSPPELYISIFELSSDYVLRKGAKELAPYAAWPIRIAATPGHHIYYLYFQPISGKYDILVMENDKGLLCEVDVYERMVTPVLITETLREVFDIHGQRWNFSFSYKTEPPVSILGTGLTSAPLKIPKEKIPSNISVDVKAQIEKLYSSDPIQRAFACYELGEMGERASPTIPFLIETLDDVAPLEWAQSPYPNGIDRYASPDKLASEALVKIGKPAIEPLITVLKDCVSKNLAKGFMEEDNSDDGVIVLEMKEEERVVCNVIDVLAKIGDNRIIEPLDALLLNGKSQFIRRTAASALGKIKSSESVEILIAALKDKKTDVREDAAEALGKIGDSRAVESLIDTLKDKHWRVRMSTAEALGEIRDNRAVEPLIELLKDEDEAVRRDATRALGKIKDTRAIEPLITSLKDKDFYVRKDAIESLEKITAQNFGQDPEKCQEWWEKNKDKFKEKNK